MATLEEIQKSLEEPNTHPFTGQPLQEAQPAPQVSGQGLVDTIANSAPTNFILGAGDAIARQMANVANLMPGVNLNVQNKGSGTAYDIGDIAGQTAGFIGGGEVLGSALGAAKAIPLLGRGAEYLAGSKFMPGMLRRATGGAAYGAVSNPNDRVGGAELGALTSAAGDTLFGAIGGIAGQVMPKKVASKITEELSPAKIKAKKQVASSLFGKAFEGVPDTSIYEVAAKPYMPEMGLTTYRDLSSSDLVKPIRDLIPSKVKLAHDVFTNNPTAENAHLLYKQFGSEIGKMNKAEARTGSLDAVSQKMRDTYQIARGAVKNDLTNFLETSNPLAAEHFNAANDYFMRNVAPYEELGNVVGAMGKDVSPEKLLSKLTSKRDVAENIAERTGRESMYPPDISKLTSQLANKIKSRDIAQRGAGIIAGGLLGHGVGAGAELAGAGIGAYIAPALTKVAGKVLPSGASTATLADYLKKLAVAHYAGGEQ